MARVRGLALTFAVLFFATSSELCHFNGQPAVESFWSNRKSLHLSGACFVKAKGTGWGVNTPTHHLILTPAYTKVQANKTASFSASFWRFWDHGSWDLLWLSGCHWHTCVIIVHIIDFERFIFCAFFIDWLGVILLKAEQVPQAIEGTQKLMQLWVQEIYWVLCDKVVDSQSW